MRIPIETIKKLSFELAVVFIGMTAAIGLDNFNESNSANKEEKELLDLMINDLDKDISQLKELIKYDSSREYSRVGTTIDFKAERFSYNSLSNSQQIRTIKNKSLMIRIFKYYQLCDEAEKVENDFLSLEREIITHLIKDDSEWLAFYYIYPKDSSLTPPKYSVIVTGKQLEDKTITQYLELNRILLGFKLYNQRRALKEAKELRADIKSYILK